MASTTTTVPEICRTARDAARTLATIDGALKDRALHAIAAALAAATPEILEANAEDLDAGRDAGLSDALIDRLRLDESRIASMADGARAIAALPDPVGEVVEGFRRPNGLEIRKVRVPLGVVAVIYEARPNVTIDAAALCLKSGNAAVLRGSRAAARTNAVLASLAADAAQSEGAPFGAINLLAGSDRAELVELATQSGLVDLIIPRGGEGLKATLLEHATVPVIYAASGNCHVYVDAAADLDHALAVAVNAKVQRPGVCNAAETLLVHRDVAAAFLPAALAALSDAGVELRGDEPTRALAGPVAVAAAADADWDEEYLALTLAVAVVDSLEDAIAHIAAHGTGHSEAIVTRDRDAARRFQLEVDAACVYVNASTRFTDGGEFGMGAEIGNSTQKLHARGPIGLRELCACKYLIEGDGHVRLPPRDGGPLTSVGILGGTFNPPHVAHLVCAAEARAQLGLDRVLMVPTGVPPHKQMDDEPGAAHRVEMCRLAIGPHTDWLEVSTIEVDRDGPSYTVDTLKQIHATRPGDELTFIVGGDMAWSLPTWREPAEILRLASMAVAERAGARREEVRARLADMAGADRIAYIDVPRMDISSSTLRSRVREGRSIDFLVPDAVGAYIHERGLYR